MEGFCPIYPRHLCCHVIKFRNTNEVLLRHFFGKQGPILIVLCSIEPGSKQHLLCSAAVPVALLLKATHLTHTCTKTLCHNRTQRRMLSRRYCHLPFRCRGTANQTNLAIRPGLCRQPAKGIIAIGNRCAKYIPLSFGEKSSPLILYRKSIAPAHCFVGFFKTAGSHLAIYPAIEIVGGAGKDQRMLAITLGPINICCQPHAIAHRYHHFLIDHGDLSQLAINRQGVLCRCSQCKQ